MRKFFNRLVALLKIIYLKTFLLCIKLRVLKLNNRVWSAMHLLLQEKEKHELKNIKKVAFILHDSISFSHCLNVMLAMPRDSFDIILVDYKSAFMLRDLLPLFVYRNAKTAFAKFLESKNKVFDKLKKDKNCKIKDISEVFGRCFYSVVVCAHNGSASRDIIE